MDNLWAPWRLKYIAGERPDACVFCAFPAQKDDHKSRILVRGKFNFVIMNAFPYSNGHLLIVPYRHTSSFVSLSDDEALDMMQLTQDCCRALDKVSSPEGFNVGLNLGCAAGAGIADHLHMHIVPRWTGDTNFMPVLGEVKVIPEDIETTYQKLKDAFESL